MAKARKKRTNYTAAQKSQILAAAAKDKLTAAQVKRKFGVTPVTYYSWRRKSGVTKKRGPGRPAGRTSRPIATSGLEGVVRAEVQSRVRLMLPEIVRTEVSSYLDSLFGGKRGRKLKV